MVGILAATAISAGTLVQFRTVFGDVEVELLDAGKPVTVQNFIRYAREGAYRDMFFHRAVHDFVIQGGGFFVTNRGTATPQLASIPTHAPITNEFGVGPFQSNTYGTIAMAKTSDPNSATSQFFFNLANNAASLDNPGNSGGFTVFGSVVRGTNVLNLLNTFAPNLLQVTNLIVNAGAPFTELPVLKLSTDSTGGLYVDFDDLVFVDVSLLSVRVEKAAGGGCRILWNSVAAQTNVVEYTLGFPPDWRTVYAEKGTGQPMEASDSEETENRFYRVRVEY